MSTDGVTILVMGGVLLFIFIAGLVVNRHRS